MSGRLILVRHGESELDAGGRFGGALDPPLSARGLLDVRALAFCIAMLRVELASCYSSRSEACRRTADAIVRRIGCSKPTAFVPELDERDHGELEGPSRSEALRRLGAGRVAILQHGPSKQGDPIRSGTISLYRREIAPKLENGAVVLVVSYLDNLDALLSLIDPGGEKLAAGAFLTGAALDLRFNRDMSLAGRDLVHETRWRQASQR